MSVWLILFWFFRSVADFKSANFSITWDKSPDPTVIGYNVYEIIWGDTFLPSAKKYDAGKAPWMGIPRVRKGQGYYHVTAYAAASIESLPSRTVYYPSFDWVFWYPPFTTKLEVTKDLETWKETNVGIFSFPFLFVEVPAQGKEFYRLSLR